MRVIGLTICLLGLVFQASAQTSQRDVIAAAGETYDDGNIKITYTIGENFVFTEDVENINLSSGFVHGTDGSVVLYQTKEELPALSLFPVPVVDELVIDSKGIDWKVVSIIGTDAKVYASELKTGEVQTLDLSNLATGQYSLLFEFANGKRLQSIIKK